MSEKIKLLPGIHELTFSDYCNVDAMNCSTLAWGKVSMRHLKAAIDGRLEREDSPALRFGRALHLRLLEPERYENGIKIIGTCTAVVGSGKRKGEPCGNTGIGVDSGGNWLCGVHGGSDTSLDQRFEYITDAEAWQIEKAAEALKEHEADALRKARGRFEITLVAEVHGVLFKARLDKLILSPAAIVDLKKVGAAKSPSAGLIGEHSFSQRIAAYGYGMQAGMYCEVATALGIKSPRWYWLCVEDDEPYTVQCYRADDNTLSAGKNEGMALLENYKRCLDTGIWPGPGGAVEPITGPDWWLLQNGVAR